MKKKLFALILAGLMTLSLAACGGSQSDSEDGAPADSGDGQSYVVGICSWLPIPRWTPPPRALPTR